MSRLDFAPKIDHIKVTDIKRGLGEFAPKPDKAISFDALKSALKKAGYTLASADVVVEGVLVREDGGLWIESDKSKQRFAIEGDQLNGLIKDIEPGSRVELTGDWQTVGKGAAKREVIRISSAKKLTARSSQAAPTLEGNTEGIALDKVQVSLEGVGGGSGLFASSIRTTSPGLTVYKGGAIVPRYYYTRQHLGNLKVDRHALRLGISYTPTPTLQLEAEIPYQRTTFQDGNTSGSGKSLGNITLWGKYRFYRTLETWGDKQAAVRLGAELPTASKDAPAEGQLAAPEFVRQQVGANNGGYAFHADLNYSQARRRFIYGANVEGVLRTERDGFCMGHELRVNTDLEYVLLPFNYQTPGRELFLILETSYVYRNRGRIGGRTVSGSSASEFYVAPGLQFTATPRFVVEASFQVPVARNTGPLSLRTDKSLLVGVRYLY